jgi:porin
MMKRHPADDSRTRLREPDDRSMAPIRGLSASGRPDWVKTPALRLCAAVIASAIGLAATPAFAADELDKTGAPIPSIASSLPQNGDPSGLRKWLYEHGLTFSFVLTSEGHADVAGGMRQGGVFQGKLETIIKADLEKMLGLRGLTFFTNSFEIHNTGGIRRDYVGSFNTIANIEAMATMRLSELWLEQQITDTFSIRFGQLAADAEFFISDNSTFLMTSDWPSITAQNLPSGGPAYPLATPGLRLKYESGPWKLLVALLNGDPAGPGPGDPQERNRYGLNFRVTDPPLLMGEAQYKYNQGKDDTGLAGIVRVGFWHHFGLFDGQRFDTMGRSLADPLSNGIPQRLRGSTGFYGVIDQQLYRPPGGGPDSGISMFSRLGISTPDRNPTELYWDGGIIFAGMLPGRPDDKIGATFLYTKMSRDAAALDGDTIAFTGTPTPIRDYELNIALVYQAQIVPGWTIQPAIHYVMHPGGHIPDPNSTVPGTAIKDATVLSLRSVITY